MAISTEASILNILKVWYKDGVENLLFRNSPLLKEITKTRVEGKTQNFAALYGRGGAVSADFLVAQAKAAKTARNAEFSVVPGDLFSVYSMNAKEVQASLSKRGAYMKVAGNKLFAATEAFRKTLAASLYGRGFGEISYLDATSLAFTANTAADITLSFPAACCGGDGGDGWCAADPRDHPVHADHRESGGRQGRGQIRGLAGPLRHRLPRPAGRRPRRDAGRSV